jgi:hypothetical protein
MPFVKGESGNPAGRPPGSRNTKTLLREAMLDAEGDDITRQLIAKALEGNCTALRLCAERVLPRGVNRPIAFELPWVDSAEAARQAVGAVIGAMSRAELAPREGDEMLRVLERGAKIIATAEAAEAHARAGQPRHVQVTWIDPKEKKEKWKDYWKRRYREAYEAQYGPLPEVADPEEDGMLPPETSPKQPPAAPPDKGPPDLDAPFPPSMTGRTETRNNENNENNENNDNNGNNGNTEAPAEPQPARRPRRYDGPPRTAWTVRAAGEVLPALIPILRGWRAAAARLRRASDAGAAGGPPLVVAPA